MGEPGDVSGASEDRQSLAARVMHLLFDRQGVHERKRSKLVQDLLGISYQAAYRRVNADGSWSLEELEQVAKHFGESLPDLFQAFHEGHAVPATFRCDSFSSPCRVWLGEPTDAGAPTPLIARRESDEWVVMPAASLGTPSVAVQSVLLQPSVPKRHRIALVDDEPDTLEGVSAYLTEVGFETHPFSTFDALRLAAENAEFDAYILDWWVGAQTALETIATIRANDGECPIGVLTGQIGTGRIHPSDVANVIRNYNVGVPFEKPLRGPILAAWLRQSLSAEQKRRGIGSL